METTLPPAEEVGFLKFAQELLSEAQRDPAMRLRGSRVTELNRVLKGALNVYGSSAVWSWSDDAAQDFNGCLGLLDLEHISQCETSLDAVQKSLDAPEWSTAHSEVTNVVAAEGARIQKIPKGDDAADALTPEKRADVLNSLTALKSESRKLSGAVEHAAACLDDIDTYRQLLSAAEAATARLRVPDAPVPRALRSLDQRYTAVIGTAPKQYSALAKTRRLGDQPVNRPWQEVQSVAELRVQTAQDLNDAFLALPGREADSVFQKIFMQVGGGSLGGSILGVGALGGLIGIFAYLKAIKELHDIGGIASSALLSTGDVADFAMRLAPTFVLLLFVFVALVSCWVATLKVKRRHPIHFDWNTAVSALVLVAAVVVWWLWIPPISAFDVTHVLSVVALVAVVVPMALMARAAAKDELGSFDRVQMGLLAMLRAIAAPWGVLLSLLTIGSLITASSASVIWAHEGDRGDANAASYVVEGTSATNRPLFVASRAARVGTFWLVEEKQERTASSPVKLLMVSASQVACVRDLMPRETAASPSRVCFPAPVPSVAPPPPAPPGPPPAVLDDRATVAGFARNSLGCSAQSLQRAPIAVLRFARDVPRAGDSNPVPIDSGSLWSVPPDALRQRGLGGLHADAVIAPVNLQSVSAELARSPRATVWVLGFASYSGMPSSNLDLSARRAEVLRRHLENADRGFRARIKTVPLGVTLSGLDGDQDSRLDQLAAAFACEPG